MKEKRLHKSRREGILNNFIEARCFVWQTVGALSVRVLTPPNTRACKAER